MTSAKEKDYRPCWYELSVKDSATLFLHLHRPGLAWIEAHPFDSAFLKWFTDAHRLESFTPIRGGACGFGEVLLAGKSERPEWVTWEITLPRISSPNKNVEWSPRRVLALRATLSVLFRNLLWPLEDEDVGDEAYEQVLVIQAVGLPEPGDIGGGNTAGIGVTLMPPVCRWVSRQLNEQHNEQIVEAMRAAHLHMWPRDGKLYRLGARCRHPKWLMLDAPGDACDLSPTSWSGDPLEQYELHGHNVDSALQQFTFLAGLAKLHDLVRADSRGAS
jgi:hypothetical protein